MQAVLSGRAFAAWFNTRPRQVDVHRMADWLSKMMNKVKPAAAGSAAAPVTKGGATSVRNALQAAHRNRCKVFLEVPNQKVVAATQVEQITNDEIVIAQPSIGGMTYPLAFGEALKLSFVDQKSNLVGETKCLGRTKVTSGDGRTLFAYRLALPSSIKVEERRADPRTEITQEVAPEAQLYSGTMKSPVVGRLTNISMSGARVSMDSAAPGLSIGQELYLKFEMPDPIGKVDEVVEVQRLDFDRRNSKHTVGVSFQRRIERLETLLRIPVDRLNQQQPGAVEPMPQRKSA